MQDIISEKVYVPPEVEVQQAEVERGFGGSEGGGGFAAPDWKVISEYDWVNDDLYDF